MYDIINYVKINAGLSCLEEDGVVFCSKPGTSIIVNFTEDPPGIFISVTGVSKKEADEILEKFRDYVKEENKIIVNDEIQMQKKYADFDIYDISLDIEYKTDIGVDPDLIIKLIQEIENIIT